MNTGILFKIGVMILAINNLIQVLQIGKLKEDVRLLERQRNNLHFNLEIVKCNTDLRLKVLEEKVAKIKEGSEE